MFYDLNKLSSIAYSIIGSAMEVHQEMGYGLLEAVYEECMLWELHQRNIHAESQQEICISYKGHKLEKTYKMDVVVEEDVVVEIKSLSNLTAAHRAQLCNYLRLTKKPLGILINFGTRSIQGERWAYNERTGECFLVDRNMQRAYTEEMNINQNQ